MEKWVANYTPGHYIGGTAGIIVEVCTEAPLRSSRFRNGVSNLGRQCQYCFQRYKSRASFYCETVVAKLRLCVAVATGIIT